MNFCVDVGNALVKLGVFEGTFLKKVFCFPTENLKSTDFQKSFLKLTPDKIGISSVVPRINKKISKELKERYKIIPKIISYEDCGISLEVKNPEKVGIDRVLNCKSAYCFYGGPTIVIDIGTAITIDIVLKRGCFPGGVIMPGPGLWLESLAKTALLPAVKFKEQVKIIGKNTEEAIFSGARYGICSAVEGIVERIKKEYPGCKIVLTGGWSSKFKEILNIRIIHHPFLTLEGIGIVINEL